MTPSMTNSRHDGDSNSGIGSASRAELPTRFLRKYAYRMNYVENFKEEYHIFLSQQASLLALFFVSVVATVGFGMLCIEAFVWDPGSRTSILRLLRLSGVIPMWACVFDEFRRCRNQDRVTVSTDLQYTAVPAVWLGNLSILWTGLTGCVLLIDRCLVGSCAKDQPQSMCNPRAEQNGLPFEITITLLLCALVYPVVIKSHDLIYSIITYFITFISLVASMIIANAYQDRVTVVAMVIAVGFGLHDYEQTIFNLYISAENAKESNEEALRAARMNKSTQEEKEQLCILMGNVAHDLKTPLQAFMTEVDVLTDVLNTLFREIEKDRNSTHVTKKCRVELDEIISTLGSTYSFMLLAINRGQDFRKATAGIALQACQDTFNFISEMEWSVSRMMGVPTSVTLRILKSHISATTDTLSKMTICPMIIGDKHWFCENILSVVSNALKYTVSGGVEVEYRIAALIAEDKLQLPVVLQGPSVQDWFVPFHEEKSKSLNIDLSNHDASAVREVTPASPASAAFIGIDGEPQCSSLSSLPASPQLYLLILVHDTGIGISSKERGSLFQSFHQAQRNTGGTGLGLFSVAKRMEALGGHCGVQGREDGKPGSTFWMAYPYKPDWSAAEAAAAGDIEQGTTITRFEQDIHSSSQTSTPFTIVVDDTIVSGGSMEQSAAVDNHSQQHEQSLNSTLIPTPTVSTNVGQNAGDVEPQLRTLLLNMLIEQQAADPLWLSTFPVDNSFWRSVLIVEDSPMVLKTLKRLFVREGFDVDIAQNGAVGLEKMKLKRYLIVMTDIQMPIMDGHEMTKRFRAHEEAHRTTTTTAVDSIGSRRLQKQLVVGMSANCSSEIERQTQESGMDYFLPKPVLKVALKQCLLKFYGSC